MKIRIKELDALRGLAAISVVIYHLSVSIPKVSYRFNLGCMGVDLFFIISGFVIFMTIQKCTSWKDFVVNRFARLYPVYWVCVSLTFLSIILIHYIDRIPTPYSNPLIVYLGNLTMLQYFLKLPNIDGPYWTLIIELCFYCFMLFLLLTKNLKQIVAISSICLVFVFLNCLYYEYIQSNYWLHKIRIIIPLVNYYPLFLSGILFYKFKNNPFNFYHFALIFVCYFLQLYLFDKCYFNKGVVSFKEYFFVLTFIYSLFFLYQLDKLKFIISRPLAKLGEISYSLYLIHSFIGTKILIPLFLTYIELNVLFSFLSALIIVILISHVLNKYVEKPSLIYIRSKFNPSIIQNTN